MAKFLWTILNRYGDSNNHVLRVLFVPHSSAFLYLGLCFYVSAMQTDLKLQLQEIDGQSKSNYANLADLEFERKLFIEIEFHGRLYE